MHDNTPPASPFNSNQSNHDEFNEDEDELVYIGYADEILNEIDNLRDEEESSDEELVDQELGASGLDDILEEDQEYVPQRDDAVITFRKHDGPVFCGCLHPTEDIAVTGGEDDKAYVWTTDTGELVHEVTGHSDSVIATEFSYDGNYLATGDMAGNIQCFKVHQNYKKVWEFVMGDMVWMKWHPVTNVLMAGSDAGEVYVWRIPSGDCKVLQGNGHKAEVGTLMPDGKRLVVGYGDGSIKLWDIKNSSTIQDIPSDSAMGHTAPVTCLAVDSDNGLFLSGSVDEKILIGGSSGPLGNLNPNAGSIESLACCSESDLKILACGTLNGKISLWDVPKQSVRLECEEIDSSGITRLLWAPGCTLMCGTLSGEIRGFDGRSGQLKFKLQGHSAEIYDMHYNKSKNLLLSVSEDATAKLFTSFLL